MTTGVYDSIDGCEGGQGLWRQGRGWGRGWFFNRGVHNPGGFRELGYQVVVQRRSCGKINYLKLEGNKIVKNSTFYIINNYTNTKVNLSCTVHTYMYIHTVLETLTVQTHL